MFFEKVKRSNGFDCYAFMVDFENMGLEWPDGYDTSQINGQAPIGVNDNYIFYAKNDELRMLDFGSFKEQVSKLPAGTGSAFNKSLEAVAIKNEEKENTYSQLSNIISAIELITNAKHGDGLSDMHMILCTGAFSGLIQKLSQSRKEYNIDIRNDELTPSKNNLNGILAHVNVAGKEVTLESILDDLDGEVFKPTLEKMQLANLDLYAVWADWSKTQMRPLGFESMDRCPVGINDNYIIWQMGKNVIQLDIFSGKKIPVPFDNIMPRLEQAANKSDTYFKEHNIEIEKLVGDLIYFGLYNTRDVRLAANMSDDIRNIWNGTYRITTENMAQGRGQFVSVRNNKSITLEEMIEIL